jgi:hypothetical protein
MPRTAPAAQASATMSLAALVEAYFADPEKAALRSIEEVGCQLKKRRAYADDLAGASLCCGDPLQPPENRLRSTSHAPVPLYRRALMALPGLA